MKVLDLFSGIGGFSLGLEGAGMETVAFCEYDEKCRQVLRKHWPDVPQYNDVRTLTKEQLDNDGITDIGLICGGYPCQPFSTAGKRQGEADDRHLWPELFRLVQEIRPTWVLCENVAGHISMGLDSVLADLASEGYQSQTFLIPACALGAFHRRDRVWIVGHTSLMFSNVSDLYGKHSEGEVSEPRDSGRQENEANRANDSGQGNETSGESEPRMGGVPYGVSGWLDGTWEQGIPRVATGVSGRVDRLKQLGNAVVPQVVEMIGKAIMEADNERAITI